SPVVRRGRYPGLPVRAGRPRVRDAHAPLEHGPLRSPADGRHDEERGHRGLVRLRSGQPRSDAAEEAAAEAAAAASAGADCCGKVNEPRLRTSDYGLQTSDYGLQTSDYGLRTSDYGLRTVLRA